jgi:predicted DNA-binding transcriptional regulator
MKAAKLDAVQVCKEFEDVLAPRLKLSILERAVYSHLLRHSRHEGKLRLRFTILWLASNMGVTARRVRQAVRRLVEKGVLRLIERSNIGHVVEVLLPREVRAAHSNQSAPACSMPSGGANLEQLDFWRTRPLRLAIHAREAGLCFYCLRQTPGRDHCLDHVLPVAKAGTNSYRNLVSCCMDCNSRKRDVSAPDFLRRLFREGQLSRQELTGRLAALRALEAGKLRPKVSTGEQSGEASDGSGLL